MATRSILSWLIFKLGSIKVKVGDKVRSGQKIGKCGNSGNASVPHLHMHMQNTPVLFEGEGLPLQFQNYLADKKFVKTGEPVTGQIIRDKASQVIPASESAICILRSGYGRP